MHDPSVQRLDGRSADFWVGYLESATTHASEDLDRGEDPGAVAKSLNRALREFKSSQAARPDVEIIGFAVVDALGECYALRKDLSDAIKAQGDAADYLLGATDSGHPRANGWVRERLPLAIVGVTDEEFDEHMSNGTPTLDREP